MYFHCRSFYVAFNVISMILCFHTTIFSFYVLNNMLDCMHVPNAHTQSISFSITYTLWTVSVNILHIIAYHCISASCLPMLLNCIHKVKVI